MKLICPYIYSERKMRLKQHWHYSNWLNLICLISGQPIYVIEILLLIISSNSIIGFYIDPIVFRLKRYWTLLSFLRCQFTLLVCYLSKFKDKWMNDFMVPTLTIIFRYMNSATRIKFDWADKLAALGLS